MLKITLIVPAALYMERHLFLWTFWMIFMSPNCGEICKIIRSAAAQMYKKVYIQAIILPTIFTKQMPENYYQLESFSSVGLSTV